MKITILFTLLLSSGWMLAQPNFNTVIGALKAGNVAAISEIMEGEVELVVGDESGLYSKAEAISKVQSFFQQNKPSNCSLVHSGSARDGASYYCIGSLAAGGKKYRVYLFFKQLGSAYKIQEMRMELE